MHEVLLTTRKMSRICAKEFLELNWLNVYDRYLQMIVSDIFKFYYSQCPGYFNEIFCLVDNNRVATCSCKEKLKLTFWQFEVRNAKFIVSTA